MIKAQAARDLAEPVLNKTVETELEEFSKSIKEAANEGLFHTKRYCLDNEDVYTRLRGYGYSVDVNRECQGPHALEFFSNRALVTVKW